MKPAPNVSLREIVFDTVKQSAQKDTPRIDRIGIARAGSASVACGQRWRNHMILLTNRKLTSDNQYYVNFESYLLEIPLMIRLLARSYPQLIHRLSGRVVEQKDTAEMPDFKIALGSRARQAGPPQVMPPKKKNGLL